MSDYLGFEESYRDLHEGWLEVPSQSHGVFTIEGDDTLEWLQGQLSQDMRDFSLGQVRRACLLSPTGQIHAVMTLGCFSDKIRAFVPTVFGEALLKRAKETIFMEDVQVSQGNEVAKTVRGPEFPIGNLGRIGDIFEEPSHWAVRLDDPIEGWLNLNLPDRWVVGPGECHPQAAEAVRLELGIPKWEVDFGPKTMPPELGEDFDRRHVSYEKGCWTGQEVLMRIRSRGHTNRTWRAIVADSRMEPGDPVHLGEDRVGNLTSSAFSPKFGHVGAAMIRNQASVPGTGIEVETAGGRVRGEVRAFPLLASLSP